MEKELADTMDSNMNTKVVMATTPPSLSEEEKCKLQNQDSRGCVSAFHQNKLEINAAANWDKFYKRNETRFFKDRHWTTREFSDLIGQSEIRRNLLEIGCGVGNFIYPLVEDDLNLDIYACDFSPRAIEFVKQNKLFDERTIHPFVHDLVKECLVDKLGQEEFIDLVSIIFVFSAIHPKNIVEVLKNINKVMKKGGLVLFRDYAVNDMAMIRFKAGSKLGERFYVRQDGTRSYYFTLEEVEKMFLDASFKVLELGYVTRQTINLKEDVNATRTFLQGKFCKI